MTAFWAVSSKYTQSRKASCLLITRTLIVRRKLYPVTLVVYSTWVFKCFRECWVKTLPEIALLINCLDFIITLIHPSLVLLIQFIDIL